ncbi:nuclear transport factor 2 family protein [Croceitalea rosinachiae]|uniref:Nuclear transport factor 2 family protein n=1 Tax=Croceitalea rosinachiae TaxID=3075596 RepID=A0ABU3AB42_9FLAO|nr:nuclear transport factor 2 family protein [Croceitalea sp. F388]MDT0607407.1 nuclear transport factor 2 family protein [Croceitalea sp. F388]
MKQLLLSLCIISISLVGCKETKKTSDETTLEQESEIQQETTIQLSNKEKAIAVIESLENGNPEAMAYINPNKYIQHNLAVGDGLEGFGAVMKNAPEGGFKAKVIRALEDGDYVVLHTQYDFFGPKVGFDVFRFEEGLIVEHWDNLAAITPVNPSGRTQLDGEIAITDIEKTEENKAMVKSFVTDVLMNGEGHKTTNYISATEYLQHNSAVADGLDGLGAALNYFAENGLVMEYDTVHKILGEGNFVLTISEGKFGKGDHTSYYDLFRVKDGLVVEHWDVIETILPEADRKNENGKFGF